MNKIAFITGATAGFGKACAQKLASEGFDLILNGRRESRLEQIKKDLESKYNVAVLTSCFDVRNKNEVDKAVAALPEDWKCIDVLINNAGLALGRDYFDNALMDDWEIMIDTNLKGVIYVTHALLPCLKKSRDKKNNPSLIVNMGSVAGKEVYEKGNIYCVSKHGLDALSKSMRIDLLREGIKVSAIHPGAAETEFSMVRFKGDKETADKIYDGLTPLSAEDVAEAVFYCINQPAHVCINDLVITCTQQANSIYFNRQ